MSEKKFAGGSSNGCAVDGRLPATELLMMVSGGAPPPPFPSLPQEDALQRKHQLVFHPAQMHFVSDPNQNEISNNLESQFPTMHPGAAYSRLIDPLSSYWYHGFHLDYLKSIHSTSTRKVLNWTDGSKDYHLESTPHSMQFQSAFPRYKDPSYVDSAPSSAPCINHFTDEHENAVENRQEGGAVKSDPRCSRARDPLLILFPTADRNTCCQEHGSFSFSKAHRLPMIPSSEEYDDDVKYIGLDVVLQKELSNTDVGNVGRIVLPKREAEANLPPLFEREGMMLFMNDLVLQTTWKFRYRFWPNNKSRMYILEYTGDFVRTYGLQSGDSFILYKDDAYGEYIVRGKKGTGSSTMNRVDIQ